MKRFFLLIAGVALLATAVSCGSDDEPKPRNSVTSVNPLMINHMVNTNNGQVLGVTSVQNKLTMDTAKHTASLELHYLDGTAEKTLTLENVTAKPKRMLFYELEGTNDVNLSGYVDFNEGPSLRFVYRTPEGILVTSTMPEIFFSDTKSTIVYNDATPTSVSLTTYYQFTINPATQTAIVQVEDITHDKDLKRFINITAQTVPYTVTQDGFVIAGENLKTNATYDSFDYNTGSNTTTTDKYPFKTFNATITLNNNQLQDHLDATYMIGSNATVTATGRTYPNYTSY